MPASITGCQAFADPGECEAAFHQPVTVGQVPPQSRRVGLAMLGVAAAGVGLLWWLGRETSRSRAAARRYRRAV